MAPKPFATLNTDTFLDVEFNNFLPVSDAVVHYSTSPLSHRTKCRRNNGKVNPANPSHIASVISGAQKIVLTPFKFTIHAQADYPVLSLNLNETNMDRPSD